MHPQGWNNSGRPGRERSERAGLPLAATGLAGSAAHPDQPDGTESVAVRQRGVLKYLHGRHGKPAARLSANRKRHPPSKADGISRRRRRLRAKRQLSFGPKLAVRPGRVPECQRGKQKHRTLESERQRKRSSVRHPPPLCCLPASSWLRRQRSLPQGQDRLRAWWRRSPEPSHRARSRMRPRGASLSTSEVRGQKVTGTIRSI